MQQECVVFLSYNRRDGAEVRLLARALTESGVDPVFDEDDNRPGDDFIDWIGRSVKETQAAVFFLGPHGLGPWQKEELTLAIQEKVNRGYRVVPVILPGSPKGVEGDIPPLLTSHNWVDFRRRPIDDPQTFGRLIWGVTGKKPAEPAPARPAPPPPTFGGVEDALESLVDYYLRSENITFYLGPWAAVGGAYPDGDAFEASDASEIARMLLFKLNLIPEGYSELLPPMDVAGLYYNARWGEFRLERDVIDFINSRARGIPKTHRRLAELLGALSRRKAGRGGLRGQQLIVTSNLDLSMERALLAAGVPFTRLVQHRSAQRITVNEYRGVQPGADGRSVLLPPPDPSHGAAAQRVALDDYVALDEFIAGYGRQVFDQPTGEDRNESRKPLDQLPVQEFTGPILYKHLGSQDVRDSCAITVDHFFTFARQSLRRVCVPAKLSDAIDNTAALFLGYGFLDSDYRITYYTLLYKSFTGRAGVRYAVQLPPERFLTDAFRKMESGLWDRIKNAELQRSGITTVEEESDVFLERLIEKFREVLTT
jgi:hypothetical protein